MYICFANESMQILRQCFTVNLIIKILFYLLSHHIEGKRFAVYFSGNKNYMVTIASLYRLRHQPLTGGKNLAFKLPYCLTIGKLT